MNSWVCQCGIVNHGLDTACAQCGEAKEDGWDAGDRSRHVVLRLYSVWDNEFRDEVVILRSDSELHLALRPLAHYPWVKPSDRH